MVSDIVELEHKLQENRNRINPNTTSTSEYKLRTAAVEKEREKERREKDVIQLFDEGYNADQASYILDIPFSEVARIEEHNQRRRKFLMTGKLDLPGESTGISIFH
jgi:hypothetical protein